MILSVPNMSYSIQSIDTLQIPCMGNHVMHTSGCDFRNYRSGHTTTSRCNYFFSHRKTGAQGIRNPCMSADSEVIVSTQIGKGYYTFGFMQMNTARKICRGGESASDALSGIDVLKLGWVRTTPNAKMNTTSFERLRWQALVFALLSSTELRKERCSYPTFLFSRSNVSLFVNFSDTIYSFHTVA